MFYFIVNPYAGEGKGLRTWKKVQRILVSEPGAHSYQVFLTEKPGDARTISRKLTEKCREEKTLVVIGGDGTLNEVIDGGCFDSNHVCISYLAAGRESAFASCCKKKKPEQKIRELITAPSYDFLDYGILDGDSGNRRFVHYFSFGFDGKGLRDECPRKRLRWRSAVFQKICFYQSLWREFRKARRIRGYIQLDQEKKIEFNHIFLVTAKIRPGVSGMTVTVISTRSRLRLWRIAVMAGIGVHRKMRGVHIYPCKSFLIHTEQPMPLCTDGEIIRETRDIDLQLCERRLRIQV